MTQKVDPYLRPLFDARNELMGAFKRYRTLTRARDMLRAKLEM